MEVITTNGTVFSPTDHADLARLIYKRFGHNPEAATEAWRRMLQNNATVEDFMILLSPVTLTNSR